MVISKVPMLKIFNYCVLIAIFCSFKTDKSTPISEFIYEAAPYPACHASSIVELKNGDLLATWFGGTAEKNPDVAIYSSRKTNGKWSAPVEIFRERQIPCWNPVYFHTNDGRLWHYYKYGPSPMTWSAARRYSDDEGKSWSPIEYMPAGILGPIRARPLVLKNDIVISGSSVESYKSWAVWIERSIDNGKTFTKIGPITLDRTDFKNENNLNEWKEPFGLIQPSIVSLGGKHLKLFARATDQIGKICTSDSFDEGKTWTKAKPTDILNPNSGIDAVTLKDGRIIIIYNNSKDERSPLNLAVSKDGEHFKMFLELENTVGEFSYPNVIQGKDGDLNICYTWNRKKIKYVKFALNEIPKH